MITLSLQSGSNGNCYYYESGDIKLVFDAGISFRCASERLTSRGLNFDQVSGLFISHDHSDHVCGAGVFQRKLKAPMFISRKTFEASRRCLGKLATDAVQHFVPGDTVQLGHVSVQTIPTPHDACDPCAFIVDDGKTRVGILTDLGHGFPGLRNCLSNLDVVYMESNYDEDMLRSSFYPEHLKHRIRGPHGHLENYESARLMEECCSDRTSWIFLAHLSEQNNRPDLALATHSRWRPKHQVGIEVAPRGGPSTPFHR